jgi:hypothetical protein
MEAEISAILIVAVREPVPTTDLFAGLLDRFGDLGGVELELATRRNPVRALDQSP